MSDVPGEAQGTDLSSQTSSTEAWFGPRFAELHPRLQRLHREGGGMSGPVEFAAIPGIAGLIGAIVRKRLGLTSEATHHLSVTIRHSDDGLRWSRRFDDGDELVSLFRPVGQLPDGYWLERAGPIEMKLMVEIIDGGWYWRQRGCKLFGIPLPAWLAPQVDAHKSIDGDGYRFVVAIALPLIGTAIRYGGTLAPDSQPSPARV